MIPPLIRPTQTEITCDLIITIRKSALTRPSPDRRELWSYLCALEPNPRPCNFGLDSYHVCCTCVSLEVTSVWHLNLHTYIYIIERKTNEEMFCLQFNYCQSSPITGQLSLRVFCLRNSDRVWLGAVSLVFSVFFCKTVSVDLNNSSVFDLLSNKYAPLYLMASFVEKETTFCFDFNNAAWFRERSEHY